MTRLALSTMYAQHERFDDGADFARYAAEAGYDAIEISHATPPAKLRQIADSAILPIVAIHQPAPFEQSPFGMANSELNLASLDDDERTEAAYYARRSIELAAQYGAGSVVLHMGHVADPELRDMDARLRKRSTPEHFVPGALRRSAIERRSRLVEPHLAAARRSFLELVATAAPLGIVLGIESRINFHEIPLPGELAALLDRVDSEIAGYWHDVGHAEVLHRLGYIGRDAWFADPNVRCVGAHVHDVAGFVDHRAPGRGDIDWAVHLPHLAHLEDWTLEINQFEPDEAVCATPGLLRAALSRSASPG